MPDGYNGRLPTNYQSAVASLYELGHELARLPSHKFDLAHMQVLLEALHHPERRFRSVLIAGTNGKGSTAATLASILMAAGHRTGLYTSPHLVRINERIRVGGEQIADASFAETYDRVDGEAQRLVREGALPWHPSFFEILTAMAFEHFARSGVEIAVLEVGMGGRLDATNVVEPVLSLITDIALDHQKFLGNTLTEIATEKAGIIRPGGVVVTLPQHPEANAVLDRTILERNARAINAADYVPNFTPTGDWRPAAGDYPLTVMGEPITVASPLTGRHQWRNLALAIAAAEQLNAAGIPVRPADIERGIRQTRWPGRLQLVHHGERDFLFDVAHNPAGAWALRAALSERFAERRLTFIFGVLRDKAVAEIVHILFPLAERVIAMRADNPRSADPEEIRRAAAPIGAEIICEPVFADALERARELAAPGSLIVVTGSIYVVGEAMRRLGIAV
jgi:dihydrofolate synthase/folylpolyglutamate synthase